MTRMDALVPTTTSSKWRRRLGLTAAATSMIAAAIGVKYWMGAESATAQSPQATRTSNASGPSSRSAVVSQRHDSETSAVAVVNGQKISRKVLSDGCVQRYGEEVLESMINKHLIQHHCRKRGIDVAAADVEAEIDRMAKRFKLGRSQWLEMLHNERGITPEQYARDIVWPTVALRQLAASQLTVTQQELQEKFVSEYGASVQARLIVVTDPQLATELQQRVAANPDDFPRVAMDHSEDINSASIGGLIQPIRRHVGDPAIESAAFQLGVGKVSPVIKVGRQFAILKCEQHIPARNVELVQVQDELVESIKEDKLREEANELFARLQESATIKNVYNDPLLSKSLPGVVATINGDHVTYRELAEECFERHSEEVLQIEISHLLLSQALAGQGVQITADDLNSEVVRAAELSGIVDAQGQADLNKWVQMATTDRGISREQYMRDSVWPSVALKKLTSDHVRVTDDDLQKAFESNYGPMVRCQAIVLGNPRRAQEVWEMARRNPTEKAFGDLAAEFSIEPSTKSLRGEIPPIRRHGGREQLENAAFALQNPGELSSIIQLTDKYIILRYLGRTEPLDVKFDAVREILYQDLYEKKLRLAMSERFEELQQSARIDNLLTGTTQTPQKQAAATPTARQAILDDAVRPAAANAANATRANRR